MKTLLSLTGIVLTIVLLAAPSAQAAYVTQDLALYLDARDVDGAGTSAADATGTLWKDLSGETEYDGTLINTDWDLAGAGSGSAADPYTMRFDGTDDYVALLQDPVLQLPENSLTIEIWNKISASIDDEGRPDRSYIYCEGGSSSRHKSSVYYTKASTSWAPGSVQFDHYTPSGTQVIIENAYDTEQWMQVAISKTDSDVTVYMNGAQIGSFSDVETYEGSPIVKTSIGAEINDLLRHYFIGDIALVRLYNAALGGTDIAGNYNNDCEAFGLPPVSDTLDGDLNSDGFVGGDDLDIVRSFWGQNVTPGELLEGDPSGDGFVGGDDLDIVRGNWGQGTPPAPNAVPEPMALAFFVTGVLGLLLLGRGRRK